MNARSSGVLVGVGELMTACQMSCRVPQRLNLFSKVRLVIWNDHLLPHLTVRVALQHLGHGDAIVPIHVQLFQLVFAEGEEDGKASSRTGLHRVNKISPTDTLARIPPLLTVGSRRVFDHRCWPDVDPTPDTQTVSTWRCERRPTPSATCRETLARPRCACPIDPGDS